MQQQAAVCILLLSLCGAAFAAQPGRRGHFMALAQVKSEAVCDGYAGPSAAEYRDMCAKIDAECKGGADDLLDAYNAKLKELEDECLRQKRILAGREEVHADEQADVKKEEMQVKEARVAVREKAHCPPELAQARQDLAEQEAIPNDTPADIDAECQAKKRVMEAEQCVEILRRAEAVLAKQKGDLRDESQEEDHAESRLPPQEQRVKEACDAWEAAKRAGPPSLDGLNGRCQDKRDALLAQADAAIKSLLEEYLRQKGILEGHEEDHAEESAEADQQEKVVKKATVDVRENAHCPPELEKAKAELSKQEAIPNDTPEDIDAECVAKKAVMEAEKCVEVLRRAEAVLAKEKDEHSDETQEEDQAAQKLPPQERLVACLKAALDAARAARKALPCGSEAKAEPAPAQSDEPEKKSGAARTTAATALAIVAALLCSLVHA